MNTTYLVVDTETGGLDPDTHSLLTMHLTALDEDFNFIEEISIAIKHNYYVCTAEALEKNKINLTVHHKIAIPVSEAQSELDKFLSRNYDGKNRLILVGHNPSFDKDFLLANFDSTVWKKVVSYHMLDTVTLGLLLKLKKRITKYQSLSLEPLSKTLGIESPFDGFHTARGDVDAVRLLIKKILEITHVS